MAPAQERLVREGRFYHGFFTAMASPCEALVETDDAGLARLTLAIAAAEALRIEQAFSRYRDDNTVHRINTAAGVAVCVDDETGRLLDFSAQLFDLSDGLFDITSGILRKVWKFDGSDSVPTREQVGALLPMVGWQNVDWACPNLQMPAGMEIDFGGIGKEYAVDRSLDLVTDRIGNDIPLLLNYGGDLRANRPPTDRPAWVVGVESARGDAALSGTVSLDSGALTTSGDARRFLLRDGVRYSHVLDPRTGWPVPDAPSSVTVRGRTCIETGILSTLAMLKGQDAEAFLDAQKVKYWIQRNG